MTNSAPGHGTAGTGRMQKIRLATLMSAVAVLAGLGLLLAPTMARMHTWWTTGYTYTHGYLVIAMSAWLAWDLARSRESIRVSPWWPGLVLVAGVSTGLGLAVILSIDVIQHLLLPVLLAAIVLTLGGRELLAIAAAPLALIYFALPIWEPINAPLQWLTVAVIGLPLALHDFPVVIDGFFITVPAGKFHVAGGCSGLHYLLVGAIISLFYAFSETPRSGIRLRIIGLALFLSLLTNWVRVYTLILIGQYTEMQHYLIATDHYFYGWVLFAVAMVAFFIVARRWTAASTMRRRDTEWLVERRVPVAGAVIAAVLAGTGAVMSVAVSGPGDELRPLRDVAPGITVYRRPISDWRPGQVSYATVDEGAGVYRDTTFEWFVAVYPVQGPKLDITSAENTDFDPQWQRVETVDDGAGFSAYRIVGPDGGERLVAVRRRVAGVPVRGVLSAKARQLLGLLQWRRDADFVAVSIACEGDCERRIETFRRLATEWFDGIELETRT